MQTSLIAERVTNLREKSSLSQEELSIKAGIDLETLKEIEEGNTPQRMDKIILIAWALDCKLEAILAEKPLEERIQVYAHGVDANTAKNSDIYKQMLDYLKVDDYLVRYDIR